jgi:hypothetical protein
MKKLVWGIIAIGIALWSGLAWLAYQIVGWGGHVASGNADILTPHPETVEWLSWLAIFGTGVAEWIVLAVWAIGVVIALALGALGGRLLPHVGKLSGSLKRS